MDQAEFRFYGTLNDFLPPEHQQVSFTHALKEQASVKDAIEALGVPHPEIDLILVNGVPVDFAYLVQAGDRISVYPFFVEFSVAALSPLRAALPEPLRFVNDVHLGKLATYLRLLGFDVWYQRNAPDDELAQISSQEQRVMLTQDRGLLKRRKVIYGYFVRSSDPKQQVEEVLQRYDLFGAIAPLTRCSRCNGQLHAVPKASVESQVPHFTYLSYDEFVQCEQCHQIYWKGAHYERLQTLIQGFSPAPYNPAPGHTVEDEPEGQCCDPGDVTGA